MSKTLLQGVNDVLKKVGFITGDSGELNSLTDSARQLEIDSAVSFWNTEMEALYDFCKEPLPQEATTTDITLVTDDRDYSLPNDLIAIRWPLIDRTNGYQIYKYPGGYEALRVHQRISDDWEGRPLYGCIRPTDNQLYFDRIPQSAENGLVYELTYDKDISMDAATDVFPFNDACYRQLVICVAEMWKMDRRNTDNVVSKYQVQTTRHRKAQAQAVRFLVQEIQSNNYKELGRYNPDPSDPYNA